MDERLLISALIKTYYDTGEDYLDSFLPFVIRVIPTQKFENIKNIQGTLKNRFRLIIPQHVLKSILHRAKNREYLDYKKKKYKLTKKGENYIDGLETEKEVERRINALLADMKAFFEKNGLQIDYEEIRYLLTSFVNKALEPLIEEIARSEKDYTSESLVEHNHKEKLTHKEILLIKYIKLAEKEKPDFFKTIEHIIYGSIISIALGSPEISEIIQKNNFKDLQVFLDTNIVFSILGLHAPEFNEPAQELYNLMKSLGIELKVFDFTVNEICRVIKGYTKESYKYPTTVAVDTIYSSLKRLGWSKTDAYNFITNIEDILRGKHILIENTGVDIDNYIPESQIVKYAVIKWKPYKLPSSQNHDIAAIEIIRKIRGKYVRKFTDANAIFLTSDTVLSRLDFEELGHKENGTVTEVMLDRLFSCILWIKAPHSNVPIKSIIASYSRNLFVKKRIWDKFYEIINDLKNKGTIEEENISMLFYHNYIENVLIEYDESEIDKITPEFVLEKVEESAKLKEREQEEINKSKELEFEKRLEQVISQTEKETEKRIHDEIKSNLKEKAKEEADIKSNKISWIFAGIITAILLVSIIIVLYRIYIWANKRGITSFVFVLISTILGGGSIWQLTPRIKKYIQKKIYRKLLDKLFKQKLKEVGLEEVNIK